MRVAIVDPPELPPAYDVLVGWNMIASKSTSANVPAEHYLDGMGYVGYTGPRMTLGSQFRGQFMITPRWSHDAATGCHSQNQERFIHKCNSVNYGVADDGK
jgi:hypothetical protein